MTKKEKIDLKTPLKDCNLSTRCINALESRQISDFFAVCQYSTRDLLRIQHIGKVTIKEIEDLLERYGLRLGMPVEELMKYAGKSLKKDEPQERQEEDSINWEERRWGLVAQRLPDYDYNWQPWYRDFDKAVRFADEWIKMYKEQLEKERKQL